MNLSKHFCYFQLPRHIYHSSDHCCFQRCPAEAEAEYTLVLPFYTHRVTLSPSLQQASIRVSQSPFENIINIFTAIIISHPSARSIHPNLARHGFFYLHYTLRRRHRSCHSICSNWECKSRFRSLSRDVCFETAGVRRRMGEY